METLGIVFAAIAVVAGFVYWGMSSGDDGPGGDSRVGGSTGGSDDTSGRHKIK